MSSYAEHYQVKVGRAIAEVFQKILPWHLLSHMNYILSWERRMGRDTLVTVSQALCDHTKQRAYTQRGFDILKGFEFTETKCVNCHKILVLEIRKFDR